MGDMLEVICAEAGMHLVALLPPGPNDVAVSRKAAQRGISAMPVSSCYSKPPTRGGLILGILRGVSGARGTSARTVLFRGHRKSSIEIGN